MRERFAEIGDPWRDMDVERQAGTGALDQLLELAAELGPAAKAPKGASRDGRRQSIMPLVEIARTKTKPEAEAAFGVWRDKYPEVAKLLEPQDILIDGMRGPSSIWYRVRVNLVHVPEAQRPVQEELIADYSPWG